MFWRELEEKSNNLKRNNNDTKRKITKRVRGVKKQTVLYETNNSKAEHTALMEFLFHDRENEALFIVNNKKTIAETMVDGLIDFIEETYW